MPSVLVRDVPEHVVDTLKRRAAGHRRSLQAVHLLQSGLRLVAPDLVIPEAVNVL